MSTDTITPLAALAAAGDTPRASESLAGGTAAPVADPAAGLRDDEGTSFDPALHGRDAFGNPKKTAAGRWAKKTGNGARKAKGLPASGNLVKGAMPADEPGNGQETPPAPGGFNAPPSAGESGAVDAEVMTGPAPLSPDEYRPTAKAIANGVCGAARMWRGEHWKPSDVERAELEDTITRLWVTYQLPRVGPIVELIVVLIGFAMNGEKRREDLAKLGRWLMGKKGVESIDQVGTRPATAP